MLKKIISMLIIVILVTGIFLTVGPLTPNPISPQTVTAEDLRGGFQLIPESMDSTGVKPDSSYMLKSQNNITLDKIKNLLSIDGEPAPEIIQKDHNLFRITPSSPLEQNKLYVFRIKQEDGYDITWTFQTSAMFKITSSFPDDKTTNVPVNTGIEIYFSHEEYEDPSNYFEIIPKVKGSFERHKKALVFVPQELKKATLYTVKIKKGVKLANTDYELKDDYVFMFETSADENEENGNTYKGYFSYNRLLNEYTPNEIPHLPFNFYLRQEKVKKNSIKINTQVYAYSSLESFINAIAEKDKVPSWAYYSYVKNQIPVKGLQKVLEFQQEFNNPSHGEQFIKLPQNLAEGYYLVNSNWDDITFQTLMQITDVGMYLMQAEEKTLIWLNDLSTGKPVEGAEITIAGGNVEMHGNNQNSIKFYSNEDGIAYFDTPKDIHVTDEEQQQNYYQPSYYTERKYFKIITKDNKAAVLGYSSYIYNNGRYSTNYYWRFLHTDRNLYKPDDTVCFWGFIQNRYEEKNIDKLTVEVTKSNYRPMAYMYAEDGGRRKSYIPPFTGNQPLVKQIVELKNGVFTGELQLPFLEPGSYLLVLKNDRNIIINSTYIQIKNFTKPPYKLDITKDKEAVFPGQEANFNIKASFFEGTGVPDLAINYNIGSSTGENSISGNPTTDSTGSVSIKYTPQPPSQAQGENQAYFTCHSTLPEIGAINQHDNLRVFVNDINVKLESSFINNVAIINAELNRITLDRINSGTANDHWDYLGEPVSGKALNGTIFKNTWVKIEDGQYYDYINKVTRKSYRYELKTETVKDNFVLTTGLDGKAKFEYPLPEITDGYYSAKVYCVDNSGRDMKFDTYFSSYPYYRYSYYDDNRYFLDGVKENYKIGETVELTYKKGRDILPKDGSYLFIKAQNGIKDFVLSSKSDYSTVVEEKDIPNIHIIGVYFNGITYVQSEYCNIVFDKKERDLVIEASSDKEAYKPGEEAIVKVNIKDKSGKPQKSAINISVVDEALFKLREQYVDTLDTLYMQISAGISNTYSSHQNSGVDIIGGTGMDGAERTKADNGALAMEKSSKSPSMANMALADVAFGGAGSDYLREIFKDTAFFKTIETDENGYGEYRFKLPDNVTSWRITLSGLTAGLFAGTNKTSLNVTLPFFINYTLNSTYLAGDKPVLGVNAYGSSLKKDETVYFEVRSSKDPNKFAKADGKAFERVNIPLWEFAEGKDDLIIKAFTINGSSDSIKHRVLTVNTYHQMEEAIYYNLEPGLVFEGGKTGNTRLIFSDKSTGAFLPELVSLSYTSGSRIDQRLSAKLASNIIEKYFKEEDITNIINLINRDESFKPSEYQVQDGGIAILPYGSSDIDISAKLVSLIKDEVDAFKLKQYFYSVLYDETPGVKGNALYGLAVLKEPVLLDINKAVQVENASVKDLLYLALAYCELGEKSSAQRLYDERLSNYIEEYKPYFRMNTGADNDDILESTALAAILASKLNKVEKVGMYNYCKDNATKDLLVNIEKLLYISDEIGKHSDGDVKLTYSLYGETKTRKLENGESFSITVPSTKLDQFKIIKVEGDISMVSIFKKDLADREDEGKPDSNIKVKRTYSVKSSSLGIGISSAGNTTTKNDLVKNSSKGNSSVGNSSIEKNLEKSGAETTEVNSFKQGDIIRVEIEWDILSKAVDGAYQITDYLPSGLKPIENPYEMGIHNEGWHFYRNIDGQKVTFHVSKDWKEKKPLVYFARIISPGTYKADGTIIQSVKSKEYYSIDKNAMVVIQD